MTGLCLGGGFVAYRNGNQALSQNFQRGRVVFQVRPIVAPEHMLVSSHTVASQGLTILSLIGGTWNMGTKKEAAQHRAEEAAAHPEA